MNSLLRAPLAAYGFLALGASIATACGGDESDHGNVGGAGVAVANGGSDLALAAGAGGSSAGSAASGTEGGAAGDGVEAGTPAGGAAGDGNEPGVLRIMAIGDSVTRATCWRALLWDQLNRAFASRFDLVGTLSSDSGCSPAGHDRDNQAYSSSLITEIVAGVTDARTCDPAPCPALADLQAAFASATPDVALLHFGTNDVWNNRAPAEILNGYSAVVDGLRAVNPNVELLVAQIIPMDVTETTCTGCSCAACPDSIEALNGEIVIWAAGKSTAESPINVVDQWTGFDTAVDTGDGVHPNASGSLKMADNWYEALAPLF